MGKKLITTHWSSNNQTPLLENFWLHQKFNLYSMFNLAHITLDPTHLAHKHSLLQSDPHTNKGHRLVSNTTFLHDNFVSISLQFHQVLMIERIHQIKYKYKQCHKEGDYLHVNSSSVSCSCVECVYSWRRGSKRSKGHSDKKSTSKTSS